jgi:hypothetical protein
MIIKIEPWSCHTQKDLKQENKTEMRHE